MRLSVYFFVALFLFLPISMWAQPVFRVDNVGLLRLHEGELQYYALYEKRDTLKVKEIEVAILPAHFENGQMTERPFIEISYEDNLKDTAGMFDADHRLLFVKDIQPVSAADLVKAVKDKCWQLMLKYDEDDPPAKTQFLAFSNTLMMVRKLNLQKNETHGFGSYYQNPDDSVQRWRTTDVELYSYCIVDLGNNKRIIQLYNRSNDVYGYIIPTAAGWLAEVDEDRFDLVKEQPNNNEWQSSATLMKEILMYSKLDEFYHIDSVDACKFRLVDNWGEKLLPGIYGQIIVNNYFVKVSGRDSIGQGLQLYNALLEPLKTKEVIRAAHPYHYYYKLLAGNTTQTIDMKGQVQESVHISISAFLCGTVNSYSYLLDAIEADDEEPGYYELVVKRGGIAAEHEDQKRIDFTGIDPAKTRLSFLDGTAGFSYDENTFFTSELALPFNWLLVNEGDKWGIKAFDMEGASFGDWGLITDSMQIAENRFLYTHWGGKDTPLTILPTLYDSIVVSEYSHSKPLLIYRDGLVGYFPVNKDARYKSLDDKYTFFLRFTLPDGSEGWLDVKDGKEYLDEDRYKRSKHK